MSFKTFSSKRIPILILFFLAGFVFSYSQTKSVIGIVTDTINNPLESANIIATSFQENSQLKFAITDNKGRYKLELESGVKYEVTVSYIGYEQEVLIMESNDNNTFYNFELKPTGEKLKEIIIKYDYKPIIVKKDTITYDVKNFVNGNERKMKEILEKLPGVEVDKKGNVTVQGKKVTKMLVEGKSFFGGGSKLAVENIPADALDKIEVIDNFNEVGFMKQVSDSEELAMNVKLKDNKKNFVFGDVEAGLGDSKYYLLHSALFYYSPKSNISFIGDLNNIGKSTFTFEDMLRFDGGVSSFLSGRKSLSNLYSLTDDNRDLLRNKSQFLASNFSFDTSSKLAISGFGIFSKIFTNSSVESKNNYLGNNTVTYEKKLQNSYNSSLLALGNFKLDYSPSKNEKWFYNAQYKATTNDLLSTTNSITNQNWGVFETIVKSDNSSLKQYLEWHKSFNSHHTTTFVVNNSFEKSTPQNNWLTNQIFLSGLIPLQNDVNYNVEQVKKIRNNSIDILFKHYWIINNFNHLYSNVGNNFGSSIIETSEKQLLTDGTTNDFAGSGYGNNIKSKLNDAYVGLEYKFKIGKWTNKPGVYLHFYHLATYQVDKSKSLSSILLQPQWNSEYEFNKSESLIFMYKLVNEFPETSQLANRYTLQYYNTVYKGNALLANEKYHSANLRYSKMNMYRGINLNANINFNRKVKTIRDEVQLDGINQFGTPILTGNPETNWRIYSSFSKKVYRFSFRLITNLNWLSYMQTLNGITSLNARNDQKIGVSFKTAYKKWPDFNFGYTKGFSQFNGLTKTNYYSDAISADLEVPFFKYWTYKIDYENLKNTNTNQSNFYEIANTAIFYQKKNSPFGFEISINNLFDAKVKNDYSFSDYMISEQMTSVLPRVFLFSLLYKL